ncbi:hypothetical protein J3R83DRAFT_8699 [Lanmaoa asiatica]|nr:hypothetical protein J3R83DRAFT_8699 [Lanmaoa asiatica]
MSLRCCRIYRTLEMTAIILLMLCFDTVLLLRSVYLLNFIYSLLTMQLVYALYGRRTWSCVFATCVVLVEFATTVATMVLTIPTSSYDSACIMIRLPKSTLVFVVGTFTSQAILLWLTYRKRERVVRPKLSIAYVTIRDGMLAFVCIAGKRDNYHTVFTGS